MQKTDKHKILNFLIGDESIPDFESWVYADVHLEARLEAQLYFELINFDYTDKEVLHKLQKLILDKYIPKEDFTSLIYRRLLQASGWYPNRKFEVKLGKSAYSPEFKNALNIIEEFGGLKFISPIKKEDWTLTLVEFFKAPVQAQNMKQFGLDKNLVCFASVHNNHADLYVDANNKFYQLDDVVGEDLYEYRGPDFEHMMRQLLELEETDNFQLVGKRKNS